MKKIIILLCLAIIAMTAFASCTPGGEQGGQQGQSHRQAEKEKAELVIAVSAVHKSLDRVAHKLPPYRESRAKQPPEPFL